MIGRTELVLALISALFTIAVLTPTVVASLLSVVASFAGTAIGTKISAELTRRKR